jgi:tRNA-dihydrouridine synthase B
MVAHYGPDIASRVARKHVAWYSKGLPGSAEFRARVNATGNADAMRAEIDRFFMPLLETRAAA